MALTKITNDLLDLGSDTGALELPKGTTAQRPSNPVEGTLRHNSEIDETKLETFDGTDWRKINKVPEPPVIDFLLVAGGAGGGYIGSAVEPGGGGGGGVIESLGVSVPLTTVLNIVIGAGGGVVTYDAGTNGSNSTIDFGSLTAIGGGGGGGNASYPAKAGGSGGGGSNQSTSGAAGTSGQGFAGGNANSGAGGGGGGGGQAGGSPPTSNDGGKGGDGYQSAITGTLTYYAGGGGGCGGGTSDADRGPAGLGGGGIGGYNYANGSNGATNTGGGGGGNKVSGTSSTSGGSGVAILRMATEIYSGTTTGNPTVTTDGTDTILTYTSSGTYTA